MPRQLEGLFHIDPPRGKPHWRGSTARSEVSGLAGDFLPVALFHKNDDGSSKQSRALVRWSGGLRVFRIVGIGEAAIEVVESSMVQVARALMDARQQPVRMEARQTNVTLELMPHPQQFFLGRLVVAKTIDEVREFWNVFDDTARSARVADIVRRGIASQLSALYDLGEANVRVPDDFFLSLLNVQVQAIGDPRVEYAGGGAKNVDVVSVRIAMNAKLSGHWSAGWLAHLGYGAIQPIDAYHTADTPWMSPEAMDSPNHPRVRKAQLSLRGVA